MGASFRLGFILVFNQKKRKKMRLGDIEDVRSVLSVKLCRATRVRITSRDMIYIHTSMYNTSTFLALYN